MPRLNRTPKEERSLSTQTSTSFQLLPGPGPDFVVHTAATCRPSKVPTPLPQVFRVLHLSPLRPTAAQVQVQVQHSKATRGQGGPVPDAARHHRKVKSRPPTALGLVSSLSPTVNLPTHPDRITPPNSTHPYLTERDRLLRTPCGPLCRALSGRLSVLIGC